MKCFLVPAEAACNTDSGQNDYLLTGSDYHYLVRVRRYRQGDIFPGADATGRKIMLKVSRITRDQISLKEIESDSKPSAPVNNGIVLIQCLPKGPKMDRIIRMAVESGVAGIIPVISQHSVAKPDDAQKRLKRWEKICSEACQQSGRSHPPFIRAPQLLKKAEKELKEADLGLFFHQEPLENSSLHRYLDCIVPKDSPPRLAMVIGPEGGLSESEIRFLSDLQYNPVYLGPWVMRTETAAIYAIGAVCTLLQENRIWQHIQE